MLVFFTLFASTLSGSDVKLANVFLYQPNDVLQARLGDVKPLAAYLQQVRAVCETGLREGLPEALDVVIIIKPGGKSKVWFASSLPVAAVRDDLRKEIEALSPPVVRSGAVALALSYDLHGYLRPKPDGGQLQPPIPPEWKDKAKALEGPVVVPDGFLPYIWPDENPAQP